MRILRPFLTALANSSSSSKRTSTTSAAFTTHTSFRSLVDQYDAFILDQFGVMHNGVHALEGAVECVQKLHEAGKPLMILSNTSAPSRAALAKLPKFGFDPQHFAGAVTSGEEASKYIRQKYGSNTNNKINRALFVTWDATDPNNPRLTAPPQAFLDQCGPSVALASSVDDADFLLLHGSEVWLKGSKDDTNTVDDTTAESLGNYIETGNFETLDRLLLQACADRQLPAVCANPDFVVQTPTGGTAYMPGGIAQHYQEQLGVDNVAVFGKPHPEHFEACMRALWNGEDAAGSKKLRIAHVGDSLHHDIAGANAVAGLDSVFVSSGIHLPSDVPWGTLPSDSQLQQLFDETSTTPTHVVSAFQW